MKKLLSFLIIAVGIIFSLSAHAIPVDMTTTATADNTYWIWDNSTSSWGTIISSDWRTSTTNLIDIECGVPSSLYFAILNDTSSLAPGTNNPAGFLGQLVLPEGYLFQDSGTNVLLTGNSAFSILAVQPGASFPSGDPALLSGWLTPTSYGTNNPSDPNIWSSVAGISYNSEWIWTANNANPNMDNLALVKVDFNCNPVPEPATLILLGSGLLGLAVSRKKRG